MKRYTNILSAILTFLLIGLDAHSQVLPTSVSEKKDIIYSTIGDWQGKLDMYFPKSKKKLPLVIYIHGGGWTHGSKDREYDKIKVFFENGYAVANIGYRLAGQAPAPAAINDVYTAIQFILDSAKAWNIDKNKIALMGGSAGAHLAMVVALQSSTPIYTGLLPAKPFKVAAIISKYGPTDLFTWESLKKSNSASLTWLGGRENDSAFVKSLSPFYLQDKQKIPTLFVHGSDDPTVSVHQSLALYEKMKQLNVPTENFIVNKGKHGNFGSEETAKMNKAMIAFLKKWFK